MIKVCVEVHEEAALSSVEVQAESINRAVTIIKERHRSRDVRVVFPIDPQEFFVEGSKKPGSGPSEGRQLRPHHGSTTRRRNNYLWTSANPLFCLDGIYRNETRVRDEKPVSDASRGEQEYA